MAVNKRKSNFEVLRIIAMLCIVIGHSMTHGVLTASNAGSMLPSLYSAYRFLAYGGKVGVYLFVLITGYFMVNSHISIKKIVKLWLPILFWSVFLTVIVGSILHELSIKDIAFSFFPILTNQYWFMSTYVFLYLLSPVINRAVLSTKKEQDILTILLTVLAIVPCGYLYGKNINSWLVSFCFVYTIGAIIKKYNLLQKNSFKKIGVISLVVGLICNTLISMFIGYNRNYVSVMGKISSVLAQETIFDLLIAIGIFILMGSLSDFYSKSINILASTTFGIYLIHDNPKMEELLWIKLLHFNRIVPSQVWSILYILIVDIAIFFICSLLELARKRLLGKGEEIISTEVDKVLNSNFYRK